jgi:hypothetical protein
MAQLALYSPEQNPVPPAPRTPEQTSEWYARERELEAIFFGKLVGLLVYTADTLANEACAHEGGPGCEFCHERVTEWATVLHALPLEAQQTVTATIKALGVLLPI